MRKQLHWVRKLFFVLLWFFGEVSVATAGPEENLLKAVGRIRELARQLQAAPAEEYRSSAAFGQLTELGLSLQAGGLLMSERLRIRGDALQGMNDRGRERHQAAVVSYLSAMTRLTVAMDNVLAAPSTPALLLSELVAAADGFAPLRRVPVHGLLPYRQPEFQPVSPGLLSGVVPAYRMSFLQQAQAGDLADTPEASISPAIVRQAQAIAAEAGRAHWDPAAIYHWVRSNIRTEWYWGSMKGAEETLRQRSGNDADQAALLIALFRAAGYPARYVHGTIEFFPGIAAALTTVGVDHPAQLETFFRKAGVPFELVRDGAAVSNVRIEHIWVEALIPYANYRGMADDQTGKLWLPLDTSIKAGPATNPPEIDLFSQHGNPFQGFRDRYLARDRTETPLSVLEQEAGLFLANGFPEGTGLAQVVRSQATAPGSFGIIPGSLPFREVAVLAEYPALPMELQHHVRLRAVSAEGADPFFEVVLPMRQLSGRRVMLGFEPESVADQELVNLWGGLANTPSYLVRLRPTLMVDEERRAVGNAGLAVGDDFSLVVELTAPAGTAGVERSIQAGYPLLLALVAQDALPPARDTLDGDAVGLLHRAALIYVDAWNRAEDRVAELLDVARVRPLPTLVMTGGTLRVDQLAGVPHAAEWEGLFIDAAFRGAAAIPRTAGNVARERNFFELSALEGSVQEHRIFEQEFGVAGISTARLLGLARQSGIELLTIDAMNAHEVLPTQALPVSVAEDIAAGIAAGLTVRMPASAIAHEAWVGYGYIKEHPVSGEAGYMLAGGLAGGQTVLGREDWPREMAAIMAEPFVGAPNDNPDQAFSLVAVTPPQVRLATAGEALSGPLMALVRDASGVPVSGAAVTFTVRSGGGWLADDYLHPGLTLHELTTMSGRDGIARVDFVPGEKTTVNPTVYLRDGDSHPNLVGENLIDVRLESGSRAVLPQPIAILGFAGLPDSAASGAFGNNLRGPVHSYTGNTLLLLQDRFGNPVANHPVKFSSQAATPLSGSLCQAPPGLLEEQRTARLVADEKCLQRTPIFGECPSATEVEVVSRSDGGARAGVVLGGLPAARYAIEASFQGYAGHGRSGWQHYSDAFASCVNATAAPESRMVLKYQQRLSPAGRNVDARPAGAPAELLLKAYMLKEDDKVIPGGQTLSCSPLDDRRCSTVAGTGSFSLDDPKQVTIDGQPAARAATMTNSSVLPYLYRGEVALPVGLNQVPVAAAGSVERLQIVNSCGSGCGQGETVVMPVGPEQRTVPIWGVEVLAPAAVGVMVDANGIARRELSVAYTIAPAGYVANFAQVVLYRNDELWATIPAGTSGSSAATFPAGYWFDPRSTYELQVILNNPGDANEIRSRRIPLLPRTVAVDLAVVALPAAVEDQVGAFVLLNNDFDEKDASPDVTFPDVGTPEVVETDDELKRVWLQIDDATGQAGSWQVTATDPAKLRIYYQQDGEWREFKPGDPPVPVLSYPTVVPLLLEGLVESSAVRGETVTATFSPAGATPLTDHLPVTVMLFDMAVDGNRDRKLLFDDSRDESALFWVNNDDDDRSWSSGDMRFVEDDATGNADSLDREIDGKRDLEDFSRLHVRLGKAAAPATLTYSMNLVADGGEGQPLLNLFPAVNLSDGYLGLPSQEATADQVDKQLSVKLLAAVGGVSVGLPSGVLAQDKTNYFLFEGRMPGKGHLVMTVSDRGVPVATREVALELADPAHFYDHFVVSRDETAAGGLAEAVSRRAPYTPTTDEYVLFVHGWNMQGWEKERWAETIVKRLWWQGYQGKVGLFDWPCETFSLVPGVTNFDRSEANAWRSAPTLAKLLARLNGEFPGKVNLLAHSQGNVVAGEAIRLGAAERVHTYVASQAALSASYYEGDLAVIQPALNLSPETPEVMGRYPGDPGRAPYFSVVKGKVARLVSYCNVEDYALTDAGELTAAWEYNNQTKPDETLGYRYVGEIDTYPASPLPQGGFVQGHRDQEENFLVDRELRFPTDDYEIFAFGAESRSKALGAVHRLPAFAATSAQPEAPGSRDLDMLANYNGEHYSHSRQFRSNVIDEQRYWRAFMTDAGLQRLWLWEGGE